MAHRATDSLPAQISHASSQPSGSDDCNPSNLPPAPAPAPVFAAASTSAATAAAQPVPSPAATCCKHIPMQPLYSLLTQSSAQAPHPLAWFASHPPIHWLAAAAAAAGPHPSTHLRQLLLPLCQRGLRGVLAALLAVRPAFRHTQRHADAGQAPPCILQLRCHAILGGLASGAAGVVELLEKGIHLGTCYVEQHLCALIQWEWASHGRRSGAFGF